MDQGRAVITTGHRTGADSKRVNGLALLTSEVGKGIELDRHWCTCTNSDLQPNCYNLRNFERQLLDRTITKIYPIKS